MRNDLKMALRALRRHGGYALINVFGLALGVAACLLIALYVREELTYDAFHANANRIFRMHRVPAEGSPIDAEVAMPMPAGPTLAAEFPEVEAIVRFDAVDDVPVRRRGEEFEADRVLFADPAVFEVFSFPLERGSAAAALADPASVVLSANAAERYFGATDPVGQTLAIWLGGRYLDFTVTGVARPIPTNSSIAFSVMVPFESLLRIADPAQVAADSWDTSNSITYLMLRSPADFERVEARLDAFTSRHFGSLFEELRSNGFWNRTQAPMSLRLQPLADIHLNPDVPDGLSAPTSPAYSIMLALIALGVLFIACVNFTTLAVARAADRAKEVSVRKVVGARRRELMRQFWVESLLLSGIAVLTGAAMARTALPLFNSPTEKQLSIPFEDGLWIVAALVVVGAVTGIAAGAYPAAFLSRFQPVEVFRRSSARSGRGNLFTRGLVVSQFAISAALLLATFTMSRQIDYLQTHRLGFTAEQIATLPVHTLPDPTAPERLARQLKSRPEVVSVSASNVAFTRSGNRMGMQHDGRLFEPNSFRVDADYLETMGMSLVDGRFFDPQRPADSTQAVVVNWAFAAALGLAQPVGTHLPGLQWGRLDGPEIIGVVEDFHFASMRERVAPVVMHMNPDQPVNYLMVRFHPGNARSVVAALEDSWIHVAPDVPFSFSFLDEDLDALYRSERQWRRVVGYASFFAILIACMGLFGLAVQAAAGRTKELGIRKVLGASAPRLAGMLSREFVLLVAVALAVATPLAYLGVSRWLESFAYRIGPAAFVESALVTAGVILMTAALTVGAQAVRAALRDPVRSLRYE